MIARFKYQIIIIMGFMVMLLLCLFFPGQRKEQDTVSDTVSQENKLPDAMLRSICYAVERIRDSRNQPDENMQADYDDYLFAISSGGSNGAVTLKLTRRTEEVWAGIFILH